MVREWRPRARAPVSSWLARRSTMATLTPARASSPASINPVGPAPAMTTMPPFDLSDPPIRLTPDSKRFWLQPAIMRHDPGLAASPLPGAILFMGTKALPASGPAHPLADRLLPRPQLVKANRCEASIPRTTRRCRKGRRADRLDGRGDSGFSQHHTGDLVPARTATSHDVDDARDTFLGELERGRREVSRVGRVDGLVGDHSHRLARPRTLEDLLPEARPRPPAERSRRPDHEHVCADTQDVLLARRLRAAIRRQRRWPGRFDVWPPARTVENVI